jgi:hypothetical protein
MVVLAVTPLPPSGGLAPTLLRPLGRAHPLGAPKPPAPGSAGGLWSSTADLLMPMQPRGADDRTYNEPLCAVFKGIWNGFHDSDRKGAGRESALTAGG